MERARAAPKQSSSARDQTAPGSGLRSIPLLQTFHESKDTSAKAGGSDYYSIYKRATQNFRDWMKQALPGKRLDRVSDLNEGADDILQNNIDLLQAENTDPQKDLIVPSPRVLEELATSIRNRKIVTNGRYQDGGDEGHRFMLETLEHCHTVLKFSRKVALVALSQFKNKKAQGKEQDEAKEQDEIGGRFNALVLEDDESDDGSAEGSLDEEQKIREGVFPTFQAPQQVQELDIEEDLINGEDRFQAIALLCTMDDLMGAVDQHYGLLKRYMRGQDRHSSKNGCVQLMMECAMVANKAIESVQEAESALTASHPHLSSFYHVLALIFLPHFMAELQNDIKDKSKLDREPHMVIQFVGVLVECSFHNRGNERIAPLVKRFVKKSGLAFAKVENVARNIYTQTRLEVQLAFQEQRNAQTNNMALSRSNLTPHMWLRHHTFIGGDRCILNTQNIVQKTLDMVEDGSKLVGTPGFWGPSFDERLRLATRIRGDLDEPFASMILPELIEICKVAPFARLPDRDQLITVLELLQRYVKGGRTQPVPVALTFGLHSILTSMFVIQGDGDLEHIASYSKQSYKTLFAQLDKLSDPSIPPENVPLFYANVGTFKNLVHFARPVSTMEDYRLSSVDLATAERLAFWNPVIGGDYLLYATYLCSIGLGSATVDSMGQLRFTLHLYNALKQCKANFCVPFLENLEKVFSKTKAVWVCGRPQKGSCCKRFWLSWGMSHIKATRMASEDIFSGDGLPSLLKSRSRSDAGASRKLDGIRPDQFSASYRRIVQRDFTDDDGVAEYTILNATEEARKDHKGLLDLLYRVNVTRDSMDEDEDFVLPVNFPAVGSILLEFTYALSEHMGWDPIIDEILASYPASMRYGKTTGGKTMKPGGFIASDLNLKRQGLAQLWGILLSSLDKDSAIRHPVDGDAAATFMREFFNGISKERYVFFVEREAKVVLCNPLEGSYPYGHTGKSMRDPLQSFLHFKRSKRGQPVVRLIKPGKRTPLPINELGEVATPYVEQGSKLRRLPNGKFRHIASYSLEELIALGWDGARYSSDGDHAALGMWVPFVAGYDSDSDDEYEPINVAEGKRRGVIVLPEEEIGLYMQVPDMERLGSQQLVQLERGL